MTNSVRGLFGGPAWPLVLLIVGFPLWWILGVSGFVAMIFAIPMATQLWRQRQIVAPGGFGWWILFVVWICLGVLVLWADAPGAVPGGGISRLMLFGYRLGWYLTCTVVLLWIANSSRRQIPFARVCNIVGYLFVFSVAGGLLGVLTPQVELQSLLEVILPGGVRANGFVKSLIHPSFADVQTVLGHPEARPKAPFAYANSWGSSLAMSLPFFLVGWWKHGTRFQRVSVLPVLAVALIPVIYSLNRGLWASLLLGAVVFLALQLARGRVIVPVMALVAALIAALLLVASPLGVIVSERMENQHSNNRRALLLESTVTSAATGSPVIGFGSTRDVQGSFASIAGASTPDCKGCGVPPLGTQGQIWLVIFSQGLIGALLYLAFFLTAFFRSWRCRTGSEILATTLLLFSGLQMFVYDTLEMPMYLVMIAIGVAWRDQSRAAESENYVVRVSTLRMYADFVRAARRPIAALALCGALAGLALAATGPRTYSATERVLLSPSPSYLVTGLALDQAPREITIDTEAALMLSQATLGQMTSSEAQADELRRRIAVTAEPNTSVLVVRVTAQSPRAAELTAQELVRAYLDVRREYLLDRRHQVLAALRDRINHLVTLGVATPGTEIEGGPTGSVALEMASVEEAILSIVLTSTSAGEPLNSVPAIEMSRGFLKFAASGLAIGLLLGGGYILIIQNRGLKARESAKGGDDSDGW
jgi:hypothetical protein